MPPSLLPYFYSDSAADFLAKPETQILGELTQRNAFDLTQAQRDAWCEEISLLKKFLPPYSDGSHVFFEYSIPRMGRRIDVVLLVKGIVFILEFKVGKTEFSKEDLNQVWDYALDLKNFHGGSHELSIVPILVATNAGRGDAPCGAFVPASDNVFRPLRVSAETLAGTLRDAIAVADTVENFDVQAWKESPYAPTPTIIEAANALYSSHSVAEIARSDASAKNLTETCSAVSAVISECEKQGKKAICFVTGVPGAGKTLVGLNVATQQFAKKRPAVYLFGNGPLVAVLTEALARDKIRRERERFAASDPAPRRKPPSKKEAQSEVKCFIQLVHHYRDACLTGTKIKDGEIVPDEQFFQKNREKNFVPAEHVAIFDEAQRAWTHEQLAKFMRRKKKASRISRARNRNFLSHA